MQNPPEVIWRRAQLLSTIRAFLDGRGLVEVTTPVLGKTAVPDLHIESMAVDSAAGRRFLQTSPEYFMKRLIAAGAGDIYQVGPVFRAGESGRRHNPEFQMLEWYRTDYSLEALADEAADLIRAAFAGGDVDPPLVRMTRYRELFEQRYHLNPHTATRQALRALAENEFPDECRHINDHGDEGTLAGYLDLLFSRGIEDALTGLVFVFDYPASQAALARVDEVDGDAVARRFECFIDGMEIANAYDELTDAAELRIRFELQNAMREQRGMALVEIDENLLAASEAMPRCAGIALGVDRLLQRVVGADSIESVLSFSDGQL